MKCPICGGSTEHDREYPPNPYVCDECEGKPLVLDGPVKWQQVKVRGCGSCPLLLWNAPARCRLDDRKVCADTWEMRAILPDWCALRRGPVVISLEDDDA